MTIDELAAILRPRLNAAMTVDDVAALLSPYSSDSSWVYLGGSGARQQVFRLPDDVRAVFQFNGLDLLTAYAVYQSAEELPATMPVSDVSLIPV